MAHFSSLSYTFVAIKLCYTHNVSDVNDINSISCDFQRGFLKVETQNGERLKVWPN